MQGLAKQPFILWQAVNTGQFYLIIWGRFLSNEDLLNLVQYNVAKIQGAKEAETFICRRLERKRYLYDFK